MAGNNDGSEGHRDRVGLYEDLTFGRCKAVQLNGGQPMRFTRIGLNDSLVVADNGVAYLHSGSRFAPIHMVPAAFAELTAGDFNAALMVPDTVKDGKQQYKRVAAHKIGDSNLMVDADGTLYAFQARGDFGLEGRPIGSTTDIFAKLNAGLEARALGIARRGHDPAALKTLFEVVDQSGLEREAKTALTESYKGFVRML